MKWNEISNILSRKHDHKCASELFKIKKKLMKSENYEIYQYLVISYVEAIVKNWESFEHFVTYVRLQIEASQRKTRSVKDDFQSNFVTTWWSSCSLATNFFE